MRLVFNDRNIRKMMKGRKVRAALASEAKKLEAAAGPGHKSNVGQDWPTRARASVWTDTEEARRAEATDRNLSRAAFARAIGQVGRGR